MTDFVAKARAIAATDRDAMSGTLQSYVATFEHRDTGASDRAAHAHARAVVKLAAREGVEAEVEKPSRTVAELKDEIALRNQDRDEADHIVPASTKKADLESALDADDAAQE